MGGMASDRCVLNWKREEWLMYCGGEERRGQKLDSV